MAQVGVRRILTSAYRTPPVRGEDRVHLRCLKNQCLSESPFRPAMRTTGMTLKGGPLCQSSSTTVTFLFVPTLNNFVIKLRICYAAFERTSRQLWPSSEHTTPTPPLCRKSS